jgi:hypothetical protein
MCLAAQCLFPLQQKGFKAGAGVNTVIVYTMEQRKESRERYLQ